MFVYDFYFVIGYDSLKYTPIINIGSSQSAEDEVKKYCRTIPNFTVWKAYYNTLTCSDVKDVYKHEEKLRKICLKHKLSYYDIKHTGYENMDWFSTGTKYNTHKAISELLTYIHGDDSITTATQAYNEMLEYMF